LASPSLKRWLAAIRIGRTGALLLRAGEVVLELPDLCEAPRWNHVPALIARRAAGDDVGPSDLDAIRADLDQLSTDLREALEASTLPERVPTFARMDAWLSWWRTA
jgi:hypothetical protein